MVFTLIMIFNLDSVDPYSTLRILQIWPHNISDFNFPYLQ